MVNGAALVMTLCLVGITVLISLRTRRFNATAAEFYLARRQLGYLSNASAITADYFSAASFLGVAAAIYASGPDGAWFGAGFGAGFVPVVLFFAAPLRRFGEYTLPDFLAARFQRSSLRLLAVLLVQVISLLYLAPQLLAVGEIWTVLVGRGFAGLSPYATGLVVTTMLMLFYVALGGMRGTTWNQVVQFWVLFSAMLLVLLLALLFGFHYLKAAGGFGQRPMVAPAVYTVRELPIAEAKQATSPDYWEREVAPLLHDPDAQVTVLMPVRSRMTGEPLRYTEPGGRYDRLTQFSVVLTLITGTAGLPHIMNRFYTSATGHAARATTVYVMGLVATFYSLAGLVGVFGFLLVPHLGGGGEGGLPWRLVDSVLANPDALMPFLAQSLGGDFGLGYVAAGAFAATVSTMGGLLIASAASWGHDLYEQYVNPGAPEWLKVAVGRAAVVAMAILGLGLGLLLPRLGLDRTHPALIAQMVTWAFGVAGGGFFPVLFLAIWWRGTTATGALAGMLVGGGSAILLITANLLHTLWPGAPDWVHALGQFTFPAVLAVPGGFLTIWLVSRLDRKGVPPNVNQIWARIHGTAAERAIR